MGTAAAGERGRLPTVGGEEEVARNGEGWRSSRDLLGGGCRRGEEECGTQRRWEGGGGAGRSPVAAGERWRAD
jgi:hypothetical protein